MKAVNSTSRVVPRQIRRLLAAARRHRTCETSESDQNLSIADCAAVQLATATDAGPSVASDQFTRSLLLDAQTVEPSAIDAIAADPTVYGIELRACTLIGDDTLKFSGSSNNLKALVLDGCPQILSADLSWLLRLNLDHFGLRTDVLPSCQRKFWLKCPAKTTLVIREVIDCDDIMMVVAMKNLVNLTIENFGTLMRPTWLRLCARLESLSFCGGCIVQDHTEEPLELPDSLRKLTMKCNTTFDILNEFLKSATMITELEISPPENPPPGSNVKLSTDTSPALSVLKLTCSESAALGGTVPMPPQLQELEILGCLSLDLSEMRRPVDLPSLTRVSMTSCVTSGDLFEVLGDCVALNTLEFRCCYGVDLALLEGLQSLRILILDRNLRLEDLEAFRGSNFAQQLERLEISEL